MSLLLFVLLDRDDRSVAARDDAVVRRVKRMAKPIPITGGRAVYQHTDVFTGIEVANRATPSRLLITSVAVRSGILVRWALRPMQYGG